MNHCYKGVEFADGDGYESIENIDQQGGITLQEAGGSGNGDRKRDFFDFVFRRCLLMSFLQLRLIVRIRTSRHIPC